MTALLEILVEMRRLKKSVAYILEFWRKAQSEDDMLIQKQRATILSDMCRSLRTELGEFLINLDGIEECANRITSSNLHHKHDEERNE